MKTHLKLNGKGSFLILCFCISIISCLKNKNENLNKLKNNQNKIEVSDSTKTTIICEIDGLDYHPKRNFNIINHDKNYLFVGRHYGGHGDFVNTSSSDTEPAFFVHSNQFDKWLKIKQITTRKGKFGYSEILSEEEKRKMMRCPVFLGQAHLANQEYCNLPLRTSGSIAFPDKISFDKKNGEYVLNFFSSWEIEKVKTILRFEKEGLDFKNKFKKKN